MKRSRIRTPLLSEESLSLKSAFYLFDEVRAGVLTYISERYRGSFQMQESCTLSGYVCICKDALCFFVRLLLNDLFGRSLLRIAYGQRNSEAFYLSFTYEKGVPIPENERYRLLTYAKLAKTNFEYGETETDATITLSMPFRTSLFECVYAPKLANPFFYALSDIELAESEDREAVEMKGPMWGFDKKRKL